MNDSMVFLSVALVACGLYIMRLHSLLSRYRAWSRQAASLLMMIATSKDEERVARAEQEYGFDLYPKEDDE
jgi:hypothetical protein